MTWEAINWALNNNEETGYSDAGSFIFQVHKAGVTKDAQWSFANSSTCICTCFLLFEENLNPVKLQRSTASLPGRVHGTTSH
jgi:hypothetical protein